MSHGLPETHKTYDVLLRTNGSVDNRYNYVTIKIVCTLLPEVNHAYPGDCVGGYERFHLL